MSRWRYANWGSGGGSVRRLPRGRTVEIAARECSGSGGRRDSRPKNAERGREIVIPDDQISLIGVDGLITNLSRLLRIRQKLYRHFIAHPPDLFVGIDLPDFNLHLEKRLRKSGVRTIHYVSPTVWAWRSWRIKKIRQAVDHMLVLFPFEEDYFRMRDVPATFVGHPAADELPEGTTREIRLRWDCPRRKSWLHCCQAVEIAKY